MIYANFESMLVAEDNGKRNSEESYTNKCQKHIICSYSYKLIFVDGNLSKPFKTYLDKDAVYNFINIMIKERKYCSDAMKEHFKSLW